MFQIYALVCNFIFGTLMWLFIVRLQLQWVRAPFKNSFVQAIYTYLAPVLRPIEKFIPRYGNFSIPCLVVMLLIAALWSVALMWSVNSATPWLALMLLVQSVYWQLLILLFVYVLMSFLQPSPYNEIVQVITAIVRPIVAPFRRIIPMIGPLDLSVGVCMLTLTVIYQLIVLGCTNMITGAL
jgi:YggT family protein